MQILQFFLEAGTMQAVFPINVPARVLKEKKKRRVCFLLDFALSKKTLSSYVTLAAHLAKWPDNF